MENPREDSLMKEERIGTGDDEFDRLLGGGLEPKVITQIYGEPASGKSALCLIAAIYCLRSGKGVIFIDSEGFSIERFRQIAGSDAMALADNLFLFEPADFDQQGLMIGNIDGFLRRRPIGLIILDSATGLYRTQLDRGISAMQKLTKQIVHLLGYAKRYGIPVLVTNQVYMDLQRNAFVGLGGTALAHLSKVIVRVDRVNSHRRATLEKHRSRPMGAFFNFDLVENGISPLNLEKRRE